MHSVSSLTEFKKSYHLARQAREALGSHTLALTMRADVKEGVLEMKLEGASPEEMCRLAANVEPLADPDSPLFYKTVARSLCELSEPDEQSLGVLQRVLTSQLSVGPILSLNGNTYSMQELHRLLARGGFFAEDDNTRDELGKMLSNPIAARFVWFSFFGHCSDVLRWSDDVYRIIGKLEGDHPSRFSQRQQGDNGPCIYCGLSDGGFVSSEHVYAESLGNTELVLRPGTVCDRCNNDVLSPLDDFLVNWDPVAMLRVEFLPLNPKTGKFPRARMNGLTIERIAPRHLRIVSQGNRGIRVEERGDEVLIQMRMRSRQRFDPIRLARSLYKIALGFVAHQQGSNAARLEKYSAARQFILGGSAFRNRLILSQQCVPCAQVQTTYCVLDPGTPVWINIYGMECFLNLEEKPLLRNEAQVRDAGYEVFDLWPAVDI